MPSSSWVSLDCGVCHLGSLGWQINSKVSYYLIEPEFYSINSSAVSSRTWILLFFPAITAGVNPEWASSWWWGCPYGQWDCMFPHSWHQPVSSHSHSGVWEQWGPRSLPWTQTRRLRGCCVLIGLGVFSMGGPQTSGISIPWDIRCEAQAPLQPTELEILGWGPALCCSRPSRWLWCKFQFENCS